MTNLSEELQSRLKDIAFKKSIPFCYCCYKAAPSGTCTTCLSDDLMRLVEGVGVEYGTDWVIEHLIQESLTPVDTTDSFEDNVRKRASPKGLPSGLRI